MKTINFNFNDFNLENFINDYDAKIRLVFGIHEDEPIGRIIEILNHNTLEIKHYEEALEKSEMFNAIENEEIALFMPLGTLGDDKGATLRLINMIEYKINEKDIGNLYANSDKFKLTHEILNLGDLHVSNDSSLGIVISKINDKIFINFGQYECGSCINPPTLTVKENTGKLSDEIKNYLYNYKK